MAEALTAGVHTTSCAATSAALSAVINVGRHELQRDGQVSETTWEAIDALMDALIEQLPDDPPRRVR